MDPVLIILGVALVALTARFVYGSFETRNRCTSHNRHGNRCDVPARRPHTVHASGIGRGEFVLWTDEEAVR